MRKCKFCLKPFLPYKERGEKKIYCSRNCRKRAEHVKRIERAEIKNCDYCKKEYKALWKTSRFCSRQCSQSQLNKERSVSRDHEYINKLLKMFGG